MMSAAVSRVFAPSARGLNATRCASFRLYTTATRDFEMIKVEQQGKVGLIRLNRPKALNALCTPLIDELNIALQDFQGNDEVGAIVLTGSEKAFAAGADIKEMANLTYSETMNRDLFSSWGFINNIKKPIIAAVNGFALGGGCELMMMCDIAYAGESAKFGQPEITLGTIPGIGGTQRLTRLIGKPKAMELNLTGEFMKAQEAKSFGLVADVVPDDEVLAKAMKTANKIASMSKPIVAIAKECVNTAYESSLAEGLSYEKRSFRSTFATKDQKEGMKAFIEKRKPVFTDE